MQFTRLQLLGIFKLVKPAALQTVLYNGITGLMRDPKFYRYSPVGARYSAWTPEGKEALDDYLFEMCPIIDQAERDELIKRAEEMTLAVLKK